MFQYYSKCSYGEWLGSRCGDGWDALLSIFGVSISALLPNPSWPEFVVGINLFFAGPFLRHWVTWRRYISFMKKAESQALKLFSKEPTISVYELSEETGLSNQYSRELIEYWSEDL